MTIKGKNLTSAEVQGAALLKIHHITAKIMGDVQFDMVHAIPVEYVDNNKFWQYVNDFQIIVNLSKSLIAAAEQDAKNGKPPLTFGTDMGVIGPLYYLCVNCPVVSIRTSAMEILKRCPRREGMWNSVLVAQMIQQFWDLEAQHKQAQEMGQVDVDEFGNPVSFTDNGSVHFKFFGGPTEVEMSAIGTAQVSPPESVSPEVMRARHWDGN